MDSSEYYEQDDRYYINPTLSSGEQEKFISNLRDIQGQNNTQIAEQTQNLGTNVPSNLGGLGGGEAYFTSRYQTPQVNEMTATLKAAADAQALNDVMSNYQAQLKQKYNNAYRSAQKRAAARAAAAQYPTTTSTQGGIEHEYTDDDTVELQAPISAGSNSDISKKYGRLTTSAVDLNSNWQVTQDDRGNIVYTNQPGYRKGSDGYYHPQSWFDKQNVLNSPLGKLYTGVAILQTLNNRR